MRGWLPQGRDLPGLTLVACVAAAAYLGVRLVPPSPYLSDLIVALVLGAIVVNSPLARIIGLGDPKGRDHDPYERGLRYTGKFVLRFAIILMGLKIQTSLFHPDQLVVVGAIVVCAMPTAFFVTHAATRRLGLRREMGDLLTIGTMVCGASAINALAPAINARRRDQGIAITAVFIFTLAALLLFYPAANALDLGADYAGLWAGLAVNDLSGAVAVGSQFGEEPTLIATASKSMRILLLGPLLIGFSVFRRGARAAPEGRRLSAITQYLPLFIAGYFLMFGLRVVGDAALGNDPAWVAFLDVNSVVVKVAILAVCAGIGLHINIAVIIELGWKAIVAGASASVAMAGLSLAMLWLFSRGADWAALATGATVAAATWLLYRLPRGLHPQRSGLGRRFARGDALSVREAVDLLRAHDIRETLTTEVARQVLAQVSPAIGELQPLRDSVIAPGARYRRTVYWQSERGAGSLVGVLWPAGTITAIHSHNVSGVGKTIEGAVQTLDVVRVDASHLRVAGYTTFEQGAMTTFSGAATIHAVLNTGAVDAINLHFYGPTDATPAQVFTPTTPISLDALPVGRQLAVTVTPHIVGAERVPATFWRKR